MAEAILPGADWQRPEAALVAEVSSSGNQQNPHRKKHSLSPGEKRLSTSGPLAASRQSTASDSNAGRDPIRAFTVQEGLHPRHKNNFGTPDFEVDFEQNVEQPKGLEKQRDAVEAQPSSIQPATPPLTSPSGATPVSRPASTSGENSEDNSSTGPRRLLPPQEIVEGIKAAIKSELRLSELRRHPPDAMEDKLPNLRVVSAEIETPGQSPRGELISPSGGVMHSGDSFGKAFIHQAMRLKNVVMNQKVNFMDIAKNPRLAKAARAELDGHGNSVSAGLASPPRAHDAEVERQRAALEAIDAEAEEESGINRELAHVMCTRLEAARKATEKLLGVLQACAGAEAAYVRALEAAAKVPLVGDCDGATLRAALSGFSDLPFMVGQAHVTVGAGLSDTTKGMQEAVQALRQACADISGESARVQRAIDSSRRGLHTAFIDHTAACRMMDESAVERAKGRVARPFSEAADPWLTEARVVAAHGRLQRAQAEERSFLSTAFGRVQELELQRTAAIKDVIGAFVVAYRSGLTAVKADTAPLLRVSEQIDGEADLAELTSSSEAAAETGAALGLRQTEALEAASQELLCSPEITRQGEMARWVTGSGKWTDCHFVLTRCGFLHWFNNSPPTPADILPADSLNLARCQFETGEAPEFNLVETAAGMFGRSRRMIFKASSVEECCEWAIVLREAIAASRQK